MMRSRWAAAALAAAVIAGCDGGDQGQNVELADSIGVVGAAEDSLAMEPATMPEAGLDQPPGGMGQTFQLTALQGSGVTGEVTLADRGQQAEIMVRLTGAPANSSHPGHVHTGTCDAIGGVVQPLEPIETDGTGTGTMTTNLDVTPMSLMDGQHVVVYHGTGGRPITCAQIPAHEM